jgi:polyhydroxybutyrate depolymerase
MKNTWIIALTILAFGCRPSGKGQPENLVFQDQGVQREYILYRPADLSAHAPLVVAIHGYTDHNRAFMNYTGLNELARKNGFAICYPQGLVDDSSKTFWQVGYSMHRNQKVDDVRFIATLTRFLQKKFGFDTARTFVTGMSNGGDMCILLACREPDLFKAVAPVSGCMMQVNLDSCATTAAIPVMMINGTADSTTWWNGDLADRQHYGVYLPTLETFKFFAEKNNCQTFAVDTLPDTYTTDSSFVISTRYTGGTKGNQVWLYQVVNGGHDWVGIDGNMDINAGEVAWKFFQQF